MVCEQVLDAAVGPCWQLVHHILEVGVRVVPVALGRLDQAHDFGSALACSVMVAIEIRSRLISAISFTRRMSASSESGRWTYRGRLAGLHPKPANRRRPRRATALMLKVVIDNHARLEVGPKNGEPHQVVLYALMRVLGGDIWDAVYESVGIEARCSARHPGVSRAMMRNLYRTDVIPSHFSKVRLHLSKGCAVDA